MKELLKCPFCGGEPILHTVGDWKHLYVYFCSKCNKTPVFPNEARLTPRGALRTWNRITECIKSLIELEELIERYKNMSATNIELKPCPFCGGEAEFVDNGYFKDVSCKDMNCRGYAASLNNKFKKDAIEAWNRRTDDRYRKTD